MLSQHCRGGEALQTLGQQRQLWRCQSEQRTWVWKCEVREIQARELLAQSLFEREL